MRLEPPIVSNFSSFAFFFDIDGTLAEIAARPELAVIRPEIRRVIAVLSDYASGALAIVSGRQLADIDRLVGLPNLPAAGIHGAEMRLYDGVVHLDDRLANEIVAVEHELRQKLIGVQGLIFERKPLSIALHFRANPASESDILSVATDLVHTYRGLKVITGKMIVEILPASVNKGSAVARLMSEPPFKNRTPVFIGDDLTDEDAFGVVNDAGGISVKIGAGPSEAVFGFDDVGGLHRWLVLLARTA